MFRKAFVGLVVLVTGSMVAGFEDCNRTGKVIDDTSMLRFNVNVEEPCDGQCAEGTWMRAARLNYCMDEKASGEIHALFKKCVSSCEEERSKKVMRLGMNKQVWQVLRKGGRNREFTSTDRVRTWRVWKRFRGDKGMLLIPTSDCPKTVQVICRLKKQIPVIDPKKLGRKSVSWPGCICPIKSLSSLLCGKPNRNKARKFKLSKGNRRVVIA